jgi:hypothetical protein
MLHVYTCAALLKKFSPELRGLSEMGEVVTLLQNLPTSHWTEQDVAELLSQAYVFKSLYQQSPSHLTN